MRITFNPTHGLIVIPTRLYGDNNEMIVRLALDTGATSSVVNWAVAVFLLPLTPNMNENTTKEILSISKEVMQGM